MKVIDLLNIAPQIVSVNIDIRNNGRYNYKFVVGENICVHDGYAKHDGSGFKYSRHYELEKDERIDFDERSQHFPATFWAVNPRMLDRVVLEMEITDLRLWKPYKSYLYGKPVGWEPVEAIITCDIGDSEFNGRCTKSSEVKHPKPDIEKDQMNLSDFL